MVDDKRWLDGLERITKRYEQAAEKARAEGKSKEEVHWAGVAALQTAFGRKATELEDSKDSEGDASIHER